MSNEYKYFPFYYIFDEDLKSKLIFDFYNTSTSIKEENSISYMVNEMIGSNIPFFFLKDMFVFKITRTEIQKLDVKSEYIHNKILFKKFLNCYNDLRDLFENIGSESDILEISNFKEEIIYLTAITYYFKLFESIYYTNEVPLFDKSKFKLKEWIASYKKFSYKLEKEDVKIDKKAEYNVKLKRYNLQLFGNELLTDFKRLTLFEAIAKNNPDYLILIILNKNINLTDMTSRVLFKRYSFIYFKLYQLLSFNERKYEYDSERFEKKAERFFKLLI